MKNKAKLILAFVLGILVAGTGVYAATTLASSSVAYDNSKSGGSSTNVQGALDELYEVAIKCPSDALCAKAKVGDYVRMSPTQNSFIVPSSITGYDSDQSLNTSELNLWRIININIDGTIEMVSEYVSSSAVYFSGHVGYQNYIGTLNMIASAYTNVNYVEKTRYLGYNGQTAHIYDTSKITSSTLLWKTNTSDTIASEEVLGWGDTLYSADETLITSTLGSLTAYKVGTTTTTSYWVASRYYMYSSGAGVRFFCGRIVDTSGTVKGASNNIMYGYNPNGEFSTPVAFAIRPIVTLKAEIGTDNGAGTSSSPWVLS